ncbi:heparinase II/III family protein [Cohnella fermenti]|uniref:Heparinase II/III-like C-terminal domain-containing protein n=1 Tax=Cohnella fermenti TaxID=2565925 RepID=A0A4S4BGJ5_9BACL|nr:heparinase II/III family protein [Cohnella fermenti]THF72904.1 hypothetical protein E6C55_31385 [Cohnella fermenti]
MYSFSEIHSAIVSALPRAPLFPYGLPPDGRAPWEEAASRSIAEPLLDEIRAYARYARETPIPPLPFSRFVEFEKEGTRQSYEIPYFERRGRLLALTVDLLQDSENSSSREALENLVWDICNEYTWCLPACLPLGHEAAASARVPPEGQVDLFAAETAHALAETLHLVGDRLNGWASYRIRCEIERRIWQPLFNTPVHFGWESRRDNWSAVCGGAIGMAALLLVDDRERLAGMIERLLRSLECFLESYGEDGGCQEGIGYWYYGFGYYAYFADMLFHCTEGKLDLLAGGKIKPIAEYPAAFALSGGAAINYSDVGAVVWHTGLLSKLASRLGTAIPELKEIPPFGADSAFRWPHVIRNLLWTDPAHLKKPLPEGGKLLPDMAVAVDRRYSEGEMFAFSAKGGHNDEPHNHNDLGHFLLHAAGENLLADPGAGLYTRESFGPDRYRLIHNSSEGHSVPIVGGAVQQAGRAYAAELLGCRWEGSELRLELELAGAYGLAGLTSLRREFVWNWQPNEPETQATLRLVDRFAFEPEVEVQSGSEVVSASVIEQFVSLHPPTLDNGRCVWRGERGEVALEFDPGIGEPEIVETTAPDHTGKEATLYRVRFHIVPVDPGFELHFLFRCRINAIK